MNIDKIVNAKVYEELRLTISNSNSIEIYQHCVKQLYKDFSQDMVDRNFPVWYLLLVLKWSFAYGGKFQKKSVSDIEFKRMIGLANNLMSGKSKYFRMNGGIKKFIRQMAFTQFWLQRKNFDVYIFGKQFDYFLLDDDSELYKNLFRSYSGGLEIVNFLKISVVCASVYQLAKNKLQPISITPAYVKSIYKEISDEQVNLFFDNLSLSPSKMSIYCDKQSSKPVDYQIIEETPLKKYPLLNTGNQNYLVYSPTLFFNTITSYVYDSLKFHNSDKFNGKFGYTFERSLKKILDKYGFNYIDEKAQEKKIDILKKLILF